MKIIRLAPIVFVSIAVVLTISCGGTTNLGGSGGPTQPTPPSQPTLPPQFEITNTSIPLALVGTPYSVQLAAANGNGNLTWSTSGFTPPDLKLSSGGLLTGTPSTPTCSIPLTVNVTDSSTPAQTSSTTFPYDAAGFDVELKGGQVGVYGNENNSIVFQCSTDPVSWSLVSGSLPPGLQLLPFPGVTAQLDIVGTPTQVGTFGFTVQAQDGSNRTAQQSSSISIIPLALAISDGLMQLGIVNQPYDHVVPTIGGTPPYNFTVSTGSLAPGLQLNATMGEISGTPTTAGLYQFNIKVTDTTGPSPFTFEKPYTLLVTPAALPARNDSIATATPIFPGTYIASLSPYTDSAGNAAPDQDYYSLTGNSGDTFTLGASANYSPYTSASDPGLLIAPTDPAIEILDSTGTRMTTCNDPIADSPPAGAPIAKGTGTFTDACIDHGGNGGTGSSFVTLQLPPGSNQQFYIHVFDFGGNARPDFIYSLTVTKN